MLIKLRQLVVENHGFKREINFKDFYLNVDSLISISDYSNINSFLEGEESPHCRDSYALLKIREGNRTEQVIVRGAAEEIYDLTINKKRLLRD